MRHNNKKFSHHKKPKIFYIDDNKLINICYTVINKTSAICISTISCYIDDCVTVNTTFKDFPNDLGFYPNVELLNVINEPKYNVFIYKLDVDFYNDVNTIDVDDVELNASIKDVYPNINDDIILKINQYLFNIRNADSSYSEADYEDYDEEEDYE